MLQSSNLSLTDISFLCCFSNSAQFFSMFKKIMVCPHSRRERLTWENKYSN